MAKTILIKIYQDKRGLYRWRCVAGNHKLLARSPRGYQKQAEVFNDLQFIIRKDHDAQLYKDRRGEWRWRFRGNDGRTLAIASEGYHNRKDCKHASDLLLDAKPE